MIKILFHIDTLSGGGAEKVLCNLVNHMDQSKFDITVQTLFPEEFRQYLVDGIKYKAVYPSNNKFYKYIYRLEAALGLVYRLHMKDGYDIEIAYLEFGPTKVIASSTNKKAKKIAWVHCDFEIAIKDKEAFISKARKQYKKYDRIVCVSEKCKESFVAMFGNQPDVEVVHNVIDDKEILEKARQSLPGDAEKRKFTLCTVGRLSAPKNYIRLLSAVCRIRQIQSRVQPGGRKTGTRQQAEENPPVRSGFRPGKGLPFRFCACACHVVYPGNTVLFVQTSSGLICGSCFPDLHRPLS